MNDPRNHDDPRGSVLHAQFVAENDWLRIDEICVRLSVEQQWIIEMVEHGALDPSGGSEPAAWLFPRRELPRVLAIRRLVTDLGVNLTGAAIIVELVEDRRRLLARLTALSGR